MTRVSRCLCVPLVFVLMSALTTAAAAQPLNLNSARPPKPGEGRALHDLSETLDGQIRRERRDMTALSEGPERDAARFRIAARRLIRALIDKAETIGESASAHAIAALRLNDALDGLDAMSRIVGKGQDRKLWRITQRFVAETSDDPLIIPDARETLDTYLRDRLSMLVDWMAAKSPVSPWVADSPHAGWINANPDTAESSPDDLISLIDRLSKINGISKDTITTLNRLHDTLKVADGWWTFRRTATALRGTLRRAASCAGAEGNLPDWTPDSLRSSLISSFDAAARGFAAKDTRPDAARVLDRLAVTASVLRRAGQLKPPSRQEKAFRGAVLSLATDAAAGATGSDDRLRNAATVLDLLSERSSIGDERAVPRELRPAWRVLSTDADHAEAILYEQLPRLVADRDAMTDPALVGPVAAQRSALDDLRMLATIGKWLNAWQNTPMAPTTPGPRDRGAQQRLAAMRILRLSQSLTRPAEKADALTSLRAFGRDLRDLMQVDGESDLQERATGAWDTFTGDRADELASQIERTRADWLGAWAARGSGRDTGEDPGALATRLRTLARLTGFIRDAVTLDDLLAAARGHGFRRAPAPTGLLGWPGCYLSTASIRAMQDDAAAALPDLTRRVLGSTGDTFASALDHYAESHRTHRLIAALHRQAAALKLVAAPPLPLAAAPAPPGDGAWMINSRADMAAISRYLYEYGEASRVSDRDRASKLMTYLNVRAGDVLNAPGRD